MQVKPKRITDVHYITQSFYLARLDHILSSISHGQLSSWYIWSNWYFTVVNEIHHIHDDKLSNNMRNTASLLHTHNTVQMFLMA